ncbi:fluoride efflux transporter CrcB [bacterium]|nr:fluoride efflux transporter CrcB [bacterium]
MITNILSIFIGGGIGAVLRYTITIMCRNLFSLPILGTYNVNLIGCFLIGYVFGIVLNKSDIIPQALRLFLTVGFLGGLTTFSTFSFETFELIKNGKVTIGLLYMIGSCLIGLLLTFAGYYLAQKTIV